MADPAELIEVRTLQRARSIVAAGWAQGAWAIDTRGNKVISEHPTAAKRCAASALVLGGWDDCQFSTAVRFFQKAIGTQFIGQWNDTPGRTQKEVLAKFDEAIELAKGAENG